MTWPLPTFPFSPIDPKILSMIHPPQMLFISQICYATSLHRAFASAVFPPWSSPELFSPPFLPLHFPSNPLIKCPHGTLILYLNFVLYLII